MTFIQFAVYGLGAGAAYALLALGIAVIHRGSGIINFGQGAVGMAATYIFWDLRSKDHVATALALPIALLTAAVAGVVIQFLVMRPLRGQTALTRMLATIGILITLSSATALKFPNGTEVAPSILASTSFQIGSITIPRDTMIMALMTLGVGGILFAVYKYSPFGVASSAVTENRQRAESLGINPDAVAAANWALGSALAALAGILIAPSSGLSIQVLTLLVIPALAVAVLGRFRSFPIILGAGFGIGILQTEMKHYIGNSTGWADATPFFVVLIYFTLAGRALPGRGDGIARLPRVGSGRIRPLTIVVLTVAGIVLIRQVPENWTAGLVTTGIMAIIILSVVVITGYAGQISLAQFTMAGFGAYTASRLTAVTGAPFALSLLVGVLAGIPIGIVVGLPSLRARGESLAISTLGMSVAASSLVFNNLNLTGGVVGTTVGNPSFLGIDLTTLLSPERYGVFVLICFVGCALVVANIRRSPSGRKMLSIRGNEVAAASLGINVVGTKLYAFVISAMIAALGGVLLAFESPTVSFAGYDPLSSVSVLSLGVIGGVGYNASGPIAGSALAPGAVGSNVLELFSSTWQTYLGLASGIILIAVLILNSDGVARVNIAQVHLVERGLRMIPGVPAVSDSYGRLRARVFRRPSPIRSTAEPAERVVAKTLELQALSVRFGGVAALKEVSLSVAPGEVLGLIGPNGAGKTTLVEAVTGFVASHGSVTLDGRSLSGLAPRRVAARGIARSFQSLELFDDLTVGENLLVGSEVSRWWWSLRDPFYAAPARFSAGASTAISYFELEPDLGRLPSELPYGRRRLVAIARALAREPSVLLLDEPAAGLSGPEREELSRMIVELAHERGVGILLVEHDVELVMRTCDRVVALEFGQVICSGTPDEVRNDSGVIRAYLGDAVPSPPDELGALARTQSEATA